MITEMERAIYKRDNIEAKGRLSGIKKGPPTHATLKKEMAELQSKLRGTTHDAQTTRFSVGKLHDKQAMDANHLEEASSRLLRLRQQSQRVGETITAQVYMYIYAELSLASRFLYGDCRCSSGVAGATAVGAGSAVTKAT